MYWVPLYPQKLAVTSPASGGSSAGIVRSRTQATELVIILYVIRGSVVGIATGYGDWTTEGSEFKSQKGQEY
jgi:hypothetical protein